MQITNQVTYLYSGELCIVTGSHPENLIGLCATGGRRGRGERGEKINKTWIFLKIPSQLQLHAHVDGRSNATPENYMYTQVAIDGYILPPNTHTHSTPFPCTCPSVPVTLTTVAVKSPLLRQAFSTPSSRGEHQLEWSGRRRQMSGRIKTALPGRGRGTLRLLERNLVSVRKRGKMSKNTAPHTYHRAPIKCPS